MVSKDHDSYVMVLIVLYVIELCRHVIVLLVLNQSVSHTLVDMFKRSYNRQILYQRFVNTHHVPNTYKLIDFIR